MEFPRGMLYQPDALTSKMIKLIIHIALLIMLTLISVQTSLFAQKGVNKGAVIKIGDGMHVRVFNTDFNNESNGVIKSSGKSSLYVDQNLINTLGTITVSDSSKVEVKLDMHNNDDVSVQDSSIVKVRKNIYNSGYLANYYLVEIGETN